MINFFKKLFKRKSVPVFCYDYKIAEFPHPSYNESVRDLIVPVTINGFKLLKLKYDMELDNNYVDLRLRKRGFDCFDSGDYLISKDKKIRIIDYTDYIKIRVDECRINVFKLKIEGSFYLLIEFNEHSY